MAQKDKTEFSDIAQSAPAPDLLNEKPALPIVVAQPRRTQLRRIVFAVIVLAAMWWMLNPGDLFSWIIGGPTVALAVAAVLVLPASAPQHVSLSGLVRFAFYFLTQTVLGAIDVALRAFNPWHILQPVFVTRETSLPDGPPRWILCNALTLLPGSLTADIKGASLTIHLIDPDLEPDLPELENRIRDLFSLTTLDPSP
ncbi:Na+/H+ antiporter subunit E [Tateyamaria sp. syn59]|uniref:Na+/H+ antiporter subunit E n=1 Tax=Tateyamaria sp. syn59 TaxID=2576942 RepID=UPI0016757CC7|nr:Na+/H+ antiporter subunit E [Tateyamaria sp. syn59]